MKAWTRGFFASLFLLCCLAGSAIAADATYQYDELGRVIRVDYAAGQYIIYSYDAAGNRTTVSTSTPNSTPVAVNDNITVALNTPLTFDPRTNDSDPNNYALTITATSSPSAHGTIAILLSGTRLRYTPATGYSGTDSFTYTISNGHGGTATATVSASVALGNQPPTAVNDSISTPLNTAKSFDPRVNDSDPDGDTLTITTTSTPGHGTVSTVGGTSLTYTPTIGYAGADSFTYTISDGHGHTATATVSVTVTAANPIAVNDSLAAHGQITQWAYVPPIGVIDPTTNDSDPNGFALTITAVTQGTLGTVSFNGNQVVYTSSGATTGTDTFTYTISNGHGGTATGTVTVTLFQT